jgi:hypothetical protein
VLLVSRQLRNYDFNKPEDVRSFGSHLTGHCPDCGRRIWRNRKAVLAFKVTIGFFAVIGAVGFFWGLGQVLGF